MVFFLKIIKAQRVARKLWLLMAGSLKHGGEERAAARGSTSARRDGQGLLSGRLGCTTCDQSAELKIGIRPLYRS